MPRQPKHPPHEHVYIESGGKCSTCHRTEKQVASLVVGRARLAEKHAKGRARKVGVDVLTGNEPAKPDVGNLGPKIVDTPYHEPKPGKPRSNPETGADQSGSSLDPIPQTPPASPTTGPVQSPVQSTGKRRSGFELFLRDVFGLEN